MLVCCCFVLMYVDGCYVIVLLVGYCSCVRFCWFGCCGFECHLLGWLVSLLFVVCLLFVGLIVLIVLYL